MFWGFLQKTRLVLGIFAKNTKTHVALHGSFSGLVSATNPVKSSKDPASLQVCTRKKFFWLGGADFL